MKILFLALFFGIARVFSSASDFSGVSDDNLNGLHDLKYVEHEPVSLDNLGIWKDDELEGRKILNLFRRLAEESVSESTEESKKEEESAKPLDATQKQLTEEEVFLIEALASYLGKRFSEKGCQVIMALICPLVPTYPGLSENIRNVTLEKCKKVNDTCKEAEEKLPDHCKNVKNQHDANKGESAEYCSTYRSKCLSLKVACNETLKDMCKAVEEKCPEEQKPSEPTVDGTIVNLHTSIVDKTLYETETVVYTETKVVTKMKTCCNDKPYLTSCQSTTTFEPQQPGEEECSITSTITVTSHGTTITKTVTIVSATDGSTSTITDKGDSTKMDGLRKLGLVYLIVGITAGIWIVV